ncbi:MAG: aromatic acid decarboxylase, partial [Porticoccaceae bacterium]|nr:aromatic acid decarboxylase [Porticoccaceae bacterium]
MPDFHRTVTLAMTGASGAAYGLRLLDCLVQARVQVYFLLSSAARIVVETETELELPPDERLEAFL